MIIQIGNDHWITLSALVQAYKDSRGLILELVGERVVKVDDKWAYSVMITLVNLAQQPT